MAAFQLPAPQFAPPQSPGPGEPRLSPALLVGAASPLWAYYGAAAAGAMTYWWLTRWTRPMNLEALYGAAADALPEAMAPFAAPLAETAETLAEVVEAVAPDLPEIPVGGEAAPMSPLLALETTEVAPAEAAAEQPSAGAAEAPDAGPDSPATAEPPPVSTAQAEETPKARLRKGASASGATGAA